MRPALDSAYIHTYIHINFPTMANNQFEDIETKTSSSLLLSSIIKKEILNNQFYKGIYTVIKKRISTCDFFSVIDVINIRLFRCLILKKGSSWALLFFIGFKIGEMSMEFNLFLFLSFKFFYWLFLFFRN